MPGSPPKADRQNPWLRTAVCAIRCHLPAGARDRLPAVCPARRSTIPTRASPRHAAVRLQLQPSWSSGATPPVARRPRRAPAACRTPHTMSSSCPPPRAGSRGTSKARVNRRSGETTCRAGVTMARSMRPKTARLAPTATASMTTVTSVVTGVTQSARAASTKEERKRSNIGAPAVHTSIQRGSRVPKSSSQAPSRGSRQAKCTHRPIVKRARAMVATTCIVNIDRAAPAAGR